jgi:hypothetical protein
MLYLINARMLFEMGGCVADAIVVGGKVHSGCAVAFLLTPVNMIYVAFGPEYDKIHTYYIVA